MQELYLPSKNGFEQKPEAKPIVSTTFQEVREIQIMTITNERKEVVGAVVAFPHEGMGYPLKDVEQIEHIGRSLLEVASMIRAQAVRPIIRKN